MESLDSITAGYELAVESIESDYRRLFSSLERALAEKKAKVDEKLVNNLAQFCRDGLDFLIENKFKGFIYLTDIAGSYPIVAYPGRIYFYAFIDGKVKGDFITGKKWGFLLQREQREVPPSQIPFEQYPVALLKSIAGHIGYSVSEVKAERGIAGNLVEA